MPDREQQIGRYELVEDIVRQLASEADGLTWKSIGRIEDLLAQLDASREECSRLSLAAEADGERAILVDQRNKELRIKLEDAEQALSRLKWRPIETAQKDGTAVMLCSMAFRKAGETCPLMGMGRWERTNDDTRCEYAWDWAFHLYPVTHWMPLPDPPLTDADPPKEPRRG